MGPVSRRVFHLSIQKALKLAALYDFVVFLPEENMDGVFSGGGVPRP